MISLNFEDIPKVGVFLTWFIQIITFIVMAAHQETSESKSCYIICSAPFDQPPPAYSSTSCSVQCSNPSLAQGCAFDEDWCETIKVNQEYITGFTVLYVFASLAAELIKFVRFKEIPWVGKVSTSALSILMNIIAMGVLQPIGCTDTSIAQSQEFADYDASIGCFNDNASALMFGVIALAVAVVFALIVWVGMCCYGGCELCLDGVVLQVVVGIVAMFFLGMTIAIAKAQNKFEFGTYQIVAVTMIPFNVVCSFSIGVNSFNVDVKG
jgi:hypothetical protein